VRRVVAATSQHPGGAPAAEPMLEILREVAGQYVEKAAPAEPPSH
jgi:hypothetical protein